MSRFVAYICPSARPSSSSAVAPSAGKHRPADAAVDLDRRSVDPERPPQRVPEPSHERRGLLVVSGLDREDDELVAADPSNRVAGADDRLEPARQRLEHGVAGAVPAHVVDVLEAVEIDDDEREGLVRSARSPERLLDAVVEEHAVRQPGERIAKRLGLRSAKSPVERDPARCRAQGDDEQASCEPIGVSLEQNRDQSAQEHERAEVNAHANVPPVLRLSRIVTSNRSPLASPQYIRQ